MNFQRDHAVSADAFEHAGYVTGSYGIVRLCAAVFARVAKIGSHCGDARGACVLERTDEEKQPAQLIIGALLRSAMQTLHNIDVGAVHCLERTCFVFAILEVALFMCREGLPQLCSHCGAELDACT